MQSELHNLFPYQYWYNFVAHIQIILDVGCITDWFKCAINWVVPIILVAVIIQLGISLTRDMWHATCDLIITLNCCTWWLFIWYTTFNNFGFLHLMNRATHTMGSKTWILKKKNLTFKCSHSLNALYDFIFPVTW
jgi:hypothetical protein